MRILMLTQFYPPTLGGEERHVRNLAAALAARGHSVSVATLWQPTSPTTKFDRSVKVHYVRGSAQRFSYIFSEPDRRHAPPFPDPEVTAALWQILKEERPAIVHAHNWLAHSFLPLKHLSGAKMVLTLHDYSLICPTKRLMFQEAPCAGPEFFKCVNCATGHYGSAKGFPIVLSNRLMEYFEEKTVDMFIPVSSAVALGNHLRERHMPYEVIPNFVPNQFENEHPDLERYLQLLPDGDYLLYVGDVSREKGVEVLLHAYAQLSGAPPLMLIGRTLPGTPITLPPNVRLLGRWPHPAIMEAWRRSLLAVVPSIWPDPCPTVVMEAMVAGRAVIGTTMGGIPDIVAHGETGLVVPPGNVTALRDAIGRLLTEPELRVRFGQGGQERVQLFQADSVVPRIERVYLNLLDTSAIHPPRVGGWKAEVSR